MSSSWLKELDEFRSQQIEAIVEAAERVFLRRGLSQAKMTEIAAEAGVSRPTLYKYFRTIEELAFDVQMRSLNLLNEAVIEQVAPSQGTAIEKIHLIFEACLGFYDANPQHLRFSILFDYFYSTSHPEPQSEERYSAFLKRFSEFERLIEIGQQDGTIRPGLDAHNTAFMVQNTMLAMLQRMALRGEIISHEQQVSPRAQLEEMFAMLQSYLSASRENDHE